MTTATEPNVLDDPVRIKALRAAMVEDLRKIGAIVSDPVAAAFQAVPRHLFAPGEPLERAYGATETLLAKRDAASVATSWVSAPSVQAQMLEQADVRPGMRVLEIGSGGYNAALLAEIVGESGRVTTVDIDPDIVARAESFLAAAGYQDRVTVLEEDAEFGVTIAAPFDRIIVTAGAWDIPPSWIDQLAEDGGQLIVPLRIRGLTRSITFERDGDHLVSRNYRLCAFVPMQGEGEHDKRLITLDEVGVALWVDEDHQFVDAEALGKALHSEPVTVWPGVGFGLPDESEFYVGTNAAAVGILHAAEDVVEAGLLAPSTIRGVPALLSADSATFAYRTKRQVSGDDVEYGVIGHGPAAEDLAGDLAHMLRDWSESFRHRDAASIHVYPKATPDAELPAGRVVDKRHSRVVVAWHKPRTP